MKCKVLFVSSELNFGGAAKMLKFVASCLDQNGYDVSIISTCQIQDEHDLPNSINHICLGIKPDKTIWRMKCIIEIRKIIQRIVPDIVCSFVSEFSVMTEIATVGLRVATCSCERGDPYTLPQMWKVLTYWAYNRSSYCIFQLSNAKAFYKRIKTKCFIIPNPYLAKSEVEPYSGIRNKTIVGAGRFVWEKGFDILIKAFSQISKEYPDEKLIIYGEGELKEQYIKLVKELGIEDKTVFPGYVNDVAKEIRKDGMFVLPSRYEGIPNVLIEALSTGIPTIASDCTPGGPRFLEQDGENGLLVPVDSIDDLVSAIRRLLEETKLVDKFEINGPKVKTRLDPEIIKREWLNAFNTMLSH